MALLSTTANGAGVGRLNVGAPVLLIAVLAMVVLPLPPMLLDMLFTFNIVLALVVVLAATYARRPLDFTAFPTILLLATLMRLALNVASTRVVLLEGHTGTQAAGKVIEAFGDFVVGGNYAVGIVVFAILVIVNFVVVTKGAGRISEVSARFTLDAMPGKQMAIDADLNAGMITQDEAQERRLDVVKEADFYGSMDGASKFVRGDAVAGLLIMFINVVGGFAIGMVQHNMAFGAAVQNYTLLTIGDGLVAQIPSLILSTAAAITVTRVSSDQDMGGQILSQLFGNPRALAVASVIIGIIGLIPGMPNVAFLALATIGGVAAYVISQRNVVAVEEEEKTTAAAVQETPQEQKELSWDDLTPVDTIGLEVGYRLIPMVDKNQGGQLMSRIKGVRKKLTQELGFLIPPVHIRDNLNLSPNAYQITLKGVTAGESEVHMERDMAINPGQVFGTLQGVEGKDPAFGLDAVWIDPGQRDQAQTMGYTVVDVSTVVATHISQLLQSRASELLGREEAQQLLDNLAKSAPKLVEDLTPNLLSIGVILKVLQNLLDEGISIRDMRTIAETLADNAPRSQDPAVLTAMVRIALGRSIVQNINGMARELPVIVLDPELEQMLQSSMHESMSDAGTAQATEGSIGLEPGLAERMLQALTQSVERQELAGQPAVLAVAAPLRGMLAKFLRHTVSALHVLAYTEIPDDMQIKVVASVGK
ncbi:MAG: flagellar biosynthesis protein FlhA [Gammaproteobacteria bacterium]|nr:flagellar biosynthesis protein FlhA [Gammaproteobacteria bacterium]